MNQETRGMIREVREPLSGHIVWMVAFGFELCLFSLSGTHLYTVACWYLSSCHCFLILSSPLIEDQWRWNVAIYEAWFAGPLESAPQDAINNRSGKIQCFWSIRESSKCFECVFRLARMVIFESWVWKSPTVSPQPGFEPGWIVKIEFVEPVCRTYQTARDIVASFSAHPVHWPLLQPQDGSLLLV